MKEVKLNPVKLGVAAGIVSGVCLFFMTLFAGYFPVFMSMVLEYYGLFGYSFSFLGAILGTIYAFIDTFVFVWLIALIYNWLIGRR